MSTLKAEPRNGAWQIHGDVPREASADVPGLKHTGTGVIGGIDAVAVAARRLGIPLPKVATVTTSLLNPPSLRRYQQEGVHRLLNIHRHTTGALLADDMGLGKTLQAITVAKQQGGRKLVVCPASVRETWRAELAKWTTDSVAALGPKSSKTYAPDWEAAPKSQWVVIGMEHDLDAAYRHAFPSDSPDFLIVDEAHNFRGREAKRAKALTNVAAECRYKLALTGTPIWSRPKDLYSLLAILFGRRFGTSFDFDMSYCGGQLNEYGAVEAKGATRSDELKLRLDYFMVRRLKGEVLSELPPLQRQVRWVDVDEKAASAMQRAVMRPSPRSTTDALMATQAGKMQAAVALALEARRFFLCTWTKQSALALQTAIRRGGGDCAVITGDVPQKKRVEIVKHCAANSIGLVATLDSVKEGINDINTVASVGIMHALDWVPLKMAQAEARIHRMGQTAGVVWYYVAMRESMDAPVLRTILSKLDASHAVLGGERGMRGDLGANEDGAGAEAMSDLYANLAASEDELGGDDDDLE